MYIFGKVKFFIINIHTLFFYTKFVMIMLAVYFTLKSCKKPNKIGKYFNSKSLLKAGFFFVFFF